MFKFAAKFTAIVWALAFAVSAATPPPKWLREKIKEIEKLHPTEELEIGKYKFEGKTVYVIPARCCDIAGEVYTPKGERVCRLEGGFAGQPEERCKDFRAQAQLLETIWRSKPAK